LCAGKAPQKHIVIVDYCGNYSDDIQFLCSLVVDATAWSDARWAKQSEVSDAQ